MNERDENTKAIARKQSTIPAADRAPGAPTTRRSSPVCNSIRPHTLQRCIGSISLDEVRTSSCSYEEQQLTRNSQAVSKVHQVLAVYFNSILDMRAVTIHGSQRQLILHSRCQILVVLKQARLVLQLIGLTVQHGAR